MTAAEQISQFIAGRTGIITTAEIIAGTTCGDKSVWAALGKMVKRGDLVRVSLGKYTKPDGAAEGAPPMMTSLLPPVKRAKASTRIEPETEIEPEDDLPIEVPVAIEMAVWHTGELTLCRDDQRITLTPSEVRELVAFLERCGMATEV